MELKEWIINWGERETSRLRNRKNPGMQLEIVQDTVESIVGLCDETELVSEVEHILKEVFKNTDNDDTTENVVVLSSIHRFKGLEADHVICYPPHPPHPLATADWQAQQEINLMYVQWTRFKKKMTVIRNRRKGMLTIPTQLAEFIGEKAVMITE
jgi:superfamily I DNA/RNA helicase